MEYPFSNFRIFATARALLGTEVDITRYRIMKIVPKSGPSILRV